MSSPSISTATALISSPSPSSATGSAAPTLTTPSTSSTTSGVSDSQCSNDYTCNPIGLLIAVILLVLLLYIILAMTRILLCFVYRRRQQTTTAQAARVNRDIEELGHPFSYLAESGFDNNGFVDPPPTYDQLFKRDEPPPIYETPATHRRTENLSRQTSTSSILAALPNSQCSVIPRSTSRNSLPTGVFGTSVPPVSAIMIDDSRSRTTTVADSPEDGFSRPMLLVPERLESVQPQEVISPTREHLI